MVFYALVDLSIVDSKSHYSICKCTGERLIMINVISVAGTVVVFSAPNLP